MDFRAVWTLKPMEKLSYKLDAFEGPLDLLLHLISKNKLNIYDIPVALLLEQYMAHIDQMRQADMDVTSEFIAVASRLIYIKTVMLMPRSEEAEELKKELTGQLIEYQLCKTMAQKLARHQNFDQFSRDESDIPFDRSYALSHEAEVLLNAYLAAVGKAQRLKPPSQQVFEEIVAKPVVSVMSRAISVLRRLYKKPSASLTEIFYASRSKSEAIATFLAVLDLLKAERIELTEDGRIKLAVSSE